jgi:hypothetical protein
VEFVQKNIYWVIAAVVSGILFILPTITKLLSRGKEIGVTAAVQLINRGMRPSSMCASPTSSKPAASQRAQRAAREGRGRRQGVGKTQGQTHLGGLSDRLALRQAAGSLQKQGFADVVTLSGGMEPGRRRHAAREGRVTCRK